MDLPELPTIKNMRPDDVLHAIGTGYLLVIRGEIAGLVDAVGPGPINPGRRPSIPVPLDVAKTVAARLDIHKLAEFRERARYGWRELIGAVGEGAELYCMVQ